MNKNAINNNTFKVSTVSGAISFILLTLLLVFYPGTFDVLAETELMGREMWMLTSYLAIDTILTGVGRWIVHLFDRKTT